MQLLYMEEWALLDRDHSNSLSGAIEALKASTLRLPVIGGARVSALIFKKCRVQFLHTRKYKMFEQAFPWAPNCAHLRPILC